MTRHWACSDRASNLRWLSIGGIVETAFTFSIFLINVICIPFPGEALVAKRLSGLEGMGDALLGFAFAAERDEGFPF